MPSEVELFEFVIKDSYKPENLPMSRLAEYLADLATMLGEKDQVHFVELVESSSAIRHAVEREAAPKVRERIHAIRTGDADNEAISAHRRTDQRLRADNAYAFLRRVGEEEERGRLLYFPGATAAQEPEFGPFNQPGQLYGTPISVGGKQALVNVNLDDGGQIYYCEASREVALQIAPLMFNHVLRVHGMGRYVRRGNGDWELRRFRIQSFDRLDPRSIDDTVGRLRAVTRKSGLGNDILAKLAELREG